MKTPLIILLLLLIIGYGYLVSKTIDKQTTINERKEVKRMNKENLEMYKPGSIDIHATGLTVSVEETQDKKIRVVFRDTYSRITVVLHRKEASKLMRLLEVVEMDMKAEEIAKEKGITKEEVLRGKI
ncbi:MAG: hypothetical protein DRP08_03960 [Candidatus Aenigmatarchaeota archaeon]|nr:MAG: hypothetical protein DRP08_03960 [Candidatus Aenigmarchaeota archaeon]